jgi:GNAT superfamily N-acetyltransferase
MSSVLQLSKPLNDVLQCPTVKGLGVRTSREHDVAEWLTLREKAFARERVGVRKWSADDFWEDFVQKWWWNPERMWLAEHPGDGGPELVGSVTLAMRGEPESAKPVVHWLMVAPRWRRQGVAKMLMSYLEVAAWEAGYREIWLETHSGWEAAGRFYEALGFTSAR